MDDVRAVMEAVGSTARRCIGVSEGGPMCALFAATYPEKTRALVMIGTYAKRLWDPRLSVGPDARGARRVLPREIRDDWGGPSASRSARRASPAIRRSASGGRPYLRMGASPGAALALTRMNAEIDIRDVLPSIRVPDARPAPHAAIAA